MTLPPNEPNASFLRSSAALVGSVCIHLLVFLFIAYLIKQNPLKTVTADKEAQSPIKVTLDPSENKQQKQAIERKLLKPQKPVAQTKPNTLATEQQTKHIVPPSKPSTQPIVPNSSTSLEKFLPRSNPEYLQKLRNQATNPKNITGDGGDIPYQPTERRRDIPIVVDRFEHKDLSLFQFSQMFHDRFGAIWNSSERWVPPESPLKPGDVVYYKIFINPNGTLNHFENLTNKIRPHLNTEHLDKIFQEVIGQTLPMDLPAKLEKNVQVTEVLAIQVVNKTLFMNFGN